ncbi:protein translocase subunit SecDF [Paenibacillus sp. BSR1-1]|uniref:protein translocase subunit SecDF n=1 Tax=Paenibacillus sp. BSR1-1 TaxID=3020845 RepID=UPI0025B2039B|nr:protein translocase subunit SecDF [Paenibacillus sp. BSR1-1]MDN3020185.1 protein translocase subunit SecDF [Paenibacillus sp. BSR1-1]
MVKRSRIIAFLLVVLILGSTMGATTKNILNNMKLGLDLQGGFEVLYEVQPAKKGQKIDKNVLASTAEALDKRINVLGVSEPNIQIEGNNRVRVQLAGVKDQNKAREILSTQANLSFRDANDRLMMDGSDLKQGGAKQTFDQNGNPSVSLTLKSADKFRKVSEEIMNMNPNVLVIWLDFEEGKDSFKKEVTKPNPKYLSAPTVKQVFNQDTVSIVGSFTAKEAQTLASLLNAGSLPVKLKEVYSTSVGAKFGEQALHDTILAGIIGVIIIYLFMLFYYRFPGFIATITLSIYIYLVLLIFDWMNGVLTLPGIAAIILGVGMAVDANIITYERIREELKVGRTIKSAFQAGEQHAFTAILDANLTTILTAGVLFFYGTSSVKGFATMLIVSVLMSFLTNVYGARLLLGLWVNSGLLKDKPGWFSVRKSQIRSLTENIDTVNLPTRFDKIDFVKIRKPIFAISGVLLVAGIIILAIFRMNLGIDFSSGTRVEVQSNTPLTTEKVEAAFTKHHLTPDDIVISGDKKQIGAVRMLGVMSKNEIADLKADFKKQFGYEPNVSTVSPTVGKELAKNAFFAILFASIGIILYVSVRFEAYMAIAAVASILHDAFFMIAIFSITRLEVDLTFIAAVLTIIGYSNHDTIVTFDRIRENMRKKKRLKSVEDIAEVVNVSIRQTLTRSINTVLTVLITVVCLMIFGSPSILNFSIALFVGLIVGVYSSIFIAGSLWYVLKCKELKKKGVIKTVKEKRKYSDQPQV